MNLLVNLYWLPQPVSSWNLHSCLHNEQKIFHNNLSVFGQIEKSFDGLNFFEDISIKLKKTELVEIS